MIIQRDQNFQEYSIFFRMIMSMCFGFMIYSEFVCFDFLVSSKYEFICDLLIVIYVINGYLLEKYWYIIKVQILLMIIMKVNGFYVDEVIVC